MMAVDNSELPLRCRFGLHKWSDHRGGIKICLREGCQKARTFSLTGTMRTQKFEKELYEKFQRYADPDTGGNGGES